jgi:hypothetical protein
MPFSSPGTRLLPKPDRAQLSPAKMVNGAGHGCLVVVRGCLLGTVQDCCERHACGTAVEDDAVYQDAQLVPPDRRVSSALVATASLARVRRVLGSMVQTQIWPGLEVLPGPEWLTRWPAVHGDDRDRQRTTADNHQAAL